VETEGPDFGVPIIGDNLGGLVGYALPWPTEIESGDYSCVIANARLIAAAPELLQLVRDALEIINDQMPGEFPAFEADARAALTKAGPQ
jgi:hypothetical protein